MLIAFIPKNIKAQHLPIFNCPQPQFNLKCSGKFIRTRVAQKECLECMRLHNTLSKHPIYQRLKKTRFSYHFGPEHIYQVHLNNNMI